MTTSTVAHLLTQELKHADIEVKGWVRSKGSNPSVYGYCSV